MQDYSTLDLTVILPAYNEEGAVGDVVRGLRETLPGLRLLVINDGSADNTAEAARDGTPERRFTATRKTRAMARPGKPV